MIENRKRFFFILDSFLLAGKLRMIGITNRNISSSYRQKTQLWC